MFTFCWRGLRKKFTFGKEFFFILYKSASKCKNANQKNAKKIINHKSQKTDKNLVSRGLEKSTFSGVAMKPQPRPKPKTALDPLWSSRGELMDGSKLEGKKGAPKEGMSFIT